MYQLYVIIFINVIHLTLSYKVTWLPNTRFSLPSNFKGGKLPCSRQTVIFPESMMSSVQIEPEASVSEFILPRDGELVLAEGVIELGSTKDSNCTNEGDVYYLEKSISSWAQPDVWSSSKFNEATPDAERIPCFDDTVEFPLNAEFTVTLPEVPQKIRELRIGGHSLSTEELHEMITSHTDQRQTFILNTEQETGIIISQEHCKSLAGCPCQKNILEIDCAAKYCPKPTCMDPIKPRGFCCDICGGFIAFDVDQSFDIISFKELVSETIKSYGKENIVYHIGRTTDKGVQLVIVEKGEYTGISAELINTLDHRIERHTFMSTEISGSPLSKSGLNGKIFMSAFLIVISLMSAMYVYYYRLPQINFPIINNRPAMFSRFSYRTESVVSLTCRDSGVGVSRGFRNPMYDSKRQRVTIEDTAVED